LFDADGVLIAAPRFRRPRRPRPTRPRIAGSLIPAQNRHVSEKMRFRLGHAQAGTRAWRRPRPAPENRALLSRPAVLEIGKNNMVPMTYSQYFSLGTAAYKYVKQAMHKGVANRILGEGGFQPGFIGSRQSCKNDLRKITGPIQTKMDEDLAKRMVNFAMKTWGKDERGRWQTDRGTLDLYAKTETMRSMAEMIEVNAKYALQFACGNCEEFSSLTFKFLKDRDVKPIDWMKQSGFWEAVSGFGNHAFVIIGRDKKTDAGNIDSWNKEVVWCDPYEDEIGGLDLIKKRFGGKELSLLYRWDTFAP
jgi:hypothetical protein